MRDTTPVAKGTITPNTCNSMSLNSEFKLVEVKRCWQSHNLWSCSTLFGTMHDNMIRSHIMTGKYVVRFAFLFCCGLNNCHNYKMMIMVMLLMMMKIITLDILHRLSHIPKLVQCLQLQRHGGWPCLYFKTLFKYGDYLSMYRDSCYKDKTTRRLSYFHNGDTYADKMESLY